MSDVPVERVEDKMRTKFKFLDALMAHSGGTGPTLTDGEDVGGEQHLACFIKHEGPLRLAGGRLLLSLCFLCGDVPLLSCAAEQCD